MRKRQDIDKVLQAQSLPADILKRLGGVMALRIFAEERLGLAAGDSYRDYVDTGREYVVWNVFAAPPLSLEARTWCYWFVGCVAYRGYFSDADARAYAADLAAAGYDVHIGGVSAYSTLGWFDDPVLNTMLREDRTYLARIIFHELAHRKLYVKDDTDFNEAFADTVAHQGVTLWLAAHGTESERLKYENMRIHEDQFTDLVMRYRARLGSAYTADDTAEEKLRNKARLLAEMKAEYRQMRTRWQDDDSYDAWFAGTLNNARLAAVATYRAYVPGFEKLLAEAGGDLPAFYARVDELRACTADQRRRILLTGPTEFSC